MQMLRYGVEGIHKAFEVNLAPKTTHFHCAMYIKQQCNY